MLLFSEPEAEAWIISARFGWMNPAAKAEQIVEDDFLLSVGLIERLAQVGHNDNWKFQTFALMNGREANCIARFQRGRLAFGR